MVVSIIYPGMFEDGLVGEVCLWGHISASQAAVHSGLSLSTVDFRNPL